MWGRGGRAKPDNGFRANAPQENFLEKEPKGLTLRCSISENMVSVKNVAGWEADITPLF